MHDIPGAASDVWTIFLVNSPWVASLVVALSVIYVVRVMRSTSTKVMDWSKDLHIEAIESRRESEKRYEKFTDAQAEKYSEVAEKVTDLFESTLAAVKDIKKG